MLIQAPSFIFVAEDSRFKTWDDFAKEAKEKPGSLKVATLGFGSVDDFSLGFLGSKGVKVNQVPFSKPSERYVSILGGHADALYEQAGDVGSFLNGKQMRPLLVFGAEALRGLSRRALLEGGRLRHRPSAVPLDRRARRHAA